MESPNWRWVWILSGIVFFFIPVCSGQQLSADFYNTSCSNLTNIVSSRVDSILASDIGLAASLLRLHFHDCFVRGCDGSVLLNGTNGTSVEKDALPNLSLRGFAEIDLIKADVEAACPGVVSCADIVALTAEVATSKVGNVSWQVLLGRRDGVMSVALEAVAALPIPTLTFDQLVQAFGVVGLDTKDMVVLSAAHTIGRTQCANVIPRVWNFNNVFNTSDPSINSTFVDFMKSVCPSTSPISFIALDSTSDTFDTQFYTNVLALKGVLASDAELIKNPLGLQTINDILSNGTFAADFGASMVKMGNIQVLTGTQGEIRKICAQIN
ncbi:hypothetical protein R1flu_004758 [Riccia fluitans]|uniref:Peroxidase n=1 Tax=Riccia fluitans TaxID=41844 RepID=A0ABD1YU34_9MARC